MEENRDLRAEGGEPRSGTDEPNPFESPRSVDEQQSTPRDKRYIAGLAGPFVVCVGMVAIEVFGYGFSTATLGVALIAGLIMSFAVFLRWNTMRVNRP